MQQKQLGTVAWVFIILAGVVVAGWLFSVFALSSPSVRQPAQSAPPASAPAVDETQEVVAFLQAFGEYRHAAWAACGRARNCFRYAYGDERFRPPQSETCLVERLPECVYASDRAMAALATTPSSIRDIFVPNADGFMDERFAAELALDILREQAPDLPPADGDDVFSWRLDQLSPELRSRVDELYERPLGNTVPMTEWLNAHHVCVPEHSCSPQKVEDGRPGVVMPQYERTTPIPGAR